MVVIHFSIECEHYYYVTLILAQLPIEQSSFNYFCYDSISYNIIHSDDSIDSSTVGPGNNDIKL